ncbi:MAG: type II toxin-antitoxin system Phd/YefM family antitoxin [Deltaproteobacteria bacterium]|nr:type II toxin-antitoxin system Phd/YefM family antitoxin [Deltaproteobacteria bacterium]
MKTTATALRADLYRILDRVAKTGESVEIERGGKTLKIVLETPKSKWDRLEPHPEYINGDPDDLLHIDWLAFWKP